MKDCLLISLILFLFLNMYTIVLSPTLNTCSQMIKDEKAQCSLTRLWATASNERKRGAVQFIIYHYREYTLPPSLSHSRFYFLFLLYLFLTLIKDGLIIIFFIQMAMKSFHRRPTYYYDLDSIFLITLFNC